MLQYKSNHELLEEFDKKVEGHTEAKKALINLVNRSKIRYKQKFIDRVHKDFLIDTANCLLIGSSGSGKTFLVETLRDLVDFPLIKVDATKFNPSGAGDGGIKSADLAKQIKKNAAELVNSGRGIYNTIEGTIAQTVVFCDEIDKLSTKWESSGNWNKHVQANFLTLFEDTDEFSGVSFIFAGAFTGIDDVTLDDKKDDKSSNIGFNAKLPKVVKEEDKAEECLDEKIIKMGLIPELVGRISTIVKLDKFSKETYREILIKRLLPKKEQELMFFNCAHIDLTEDQIAKIIDKAMNSGQGVRFLKRELDVYVKNLEFDYELFPNKESPIPRLSHWSELLANDENAIEGPMDDFLDDEERHW